MRVKATRNTLAELEISAPLTSGRGSVRREVALTRPVCGAAVHPLHMNAERVKSSRSILQDEIPLLELRRLRQTIPARPRSGSEARPWAGNNERALHRYPVRGASVRPRVSALTREAAWPVPRWQKRACPLGRATHLRPTPVVGGKRQRQLPATCQSLRSPRSYLGSDCYCGL